MLQAGQDIKDRGLATPARAEQADELAGLHVERDVGRRSDRSAPRRATGDGEVPKRELRCGARGVPGDGGDGLAHQRNRNFSAISIWTTLPSWTTRTTVP